jgi:hypothetical protein
MKMVNSRANLMTKVPVVVLSLLVASGMFSCQKDDIVLGELPAADVELVVNWSSVSNVFAPLEAMHEVLVKQSNTRAADPDMSIESMWEQWNIFRFAVEPRPYVYDGGANGLINPPNALADFVYHTQKNVYDWWFLDVSDTGSGTRPTGTWKMKAEHTSMYKVILAVDRYWADPESAQGGWQHSVVTSPEGREAADRDWWITHADDRLKNYKATYVQVQTLCTELRQFLEDNGLFYDTGSSGRQLYDGANGMISFLTSNLSPNIIIDDGVTEGKPLYPGYYDDGRYDGGPDALIATYGNLLNSFVLDRLILEWQQQPKDGFTSNGYATPPPLHPGESTNWTRGVASRGMLFEFFFGAITPAFVIPGDPYRPFD